MKSMPQPPRFATYFVHWFCAWHRQEELEGDLDELFQQRVREVGLRQARWRYLRDVVSLLRPSLMKREHTNTYPTPAFTMMLRNYLKIAFRNLTQNRAYSFINIGGLAVGMAVALLIGLWVWDEISYNHNATNYEHIAQVCRRRTVPVTQQTDNSMTVPQPIANVLRTKYGHLFKHVVLLWWDRDYTIRVGDNSFIQKGQFIENGVIDMFSLTMLKGSQESLNDQQAILISASTAKTLFGNQDPINQPVKLNSSMDAKITGVYQDIAPNSIFGNIQFFGNFDNLKATDPTMKANETNWGNNSTRLFVQTADQVSLQQANAAISQLYQKGAPVDVLAQANQYKFSVWLYPMKDWYLYSEFKDGYPVSGRITYVWLFAIVGVFVLLLACINFMNLSTARSEKRAKEVGIRKAIGSLKRQLVYQFLSESFLVVLLAFGIALVLVLIALSAFNALADKQIQFPLSSPYFWLACVGFIGTTAFLSGLYPAFYLSSFQPIKVLKGTLRLGKYTALPRWALVVVQFTVSIVLIIGTVVVYQQIQYAQNRPVGYNRQGLIRIPMGDPDLKKRKSAIKDELLASGLASDVAFSSSPITSIWDNWGGFTWNGKNPESESNFTVTWIDEDYGKTIQWKLLQGRDFSKAFGTDADGVIISQSTATYLGLKNPVGEFITHDSDKYRRQIIGVVDNVVTESPYEPVQAGFYWLEKANPDNLGQMQVKINPNLPVRATLSRIEAVQKRLVPSAPFIYEFVDKEYADKFKAEQRIGHLALIFAVLAIIISCLGLFGLASFVTEQRTKEIGVRKVLGASVANVWALLSKEFVVLVLIGFGIATPIASYFLTNWLQKYEYRTDLSWWIFAVSGVGALAVTLLTVSYQSIKAALVNPVKSLRSE